MTMSSENQKESHLKDINMQMDSPEHIYTFLTGVKPDTVYSKRIWEGLANAFYYEMHNNPYYYNKEQLDAVLELGKQYDVSIPSEEMQKVIKFTKEAIENTENLDINLKKDFEYEFTGTPSRESTKNL